MSNFPVLHAISLNIFQTINKNQICTLMGLAVWRDAEGLGVHGNEVICVRPQVYLILLSFALLVLHRYWGYFLQIEGRLLHLKNHYDLLYFGGLELNLQLSPRYACSST